MYYTSFLYECSSLTLITSTSTSISTDTDSIWNILNYINTKLMAIIENCLLTQSCRHSNRLIVYSDITENNTVVFIKHHSNTVISDDAIRVIRRTP